MRKKTYLERIKRITTEIGEEIDSLTKELGISNLPEAIELKDAYSRFSIKASEAAPTAYSLFRYKDSVGGLYDMLADTKIDAIEGRSKLKKKLAKS